jgi:hypothetical protein
MLLSEGLMTMVEQVMMSEILFPLMKKTDENALGNVKKLGKMDDSSEQTKEDEEKSGGVYVFESFSDFSFVSVSFLSFFSHPRFSLTHTTLQRQGLAILLRKQFSEPPDTMIFSSLRDLLTHLMCPNMLHFLHLPEKHRGSWP